MFPKEPFKTQIFSSLFGLFPEWTVWNQFCTSEPGHTLRIETVTDAVADDLEAQMVVF